MLEFLKSHADPNGKATVRRLYRAFKQEPGKEGVSFLVFLNTLLRSNLDVRQEDGKAVAYGVRLPPADKTPTRRTPPKRERTEQLRLCGVCSGIVHPAYLEGRCEDCRAVEWDRLRVRGSRYLIPYLRGEHAGLSDRESTDERVRGDRSADARVADHQDSTAHAS